MKQKVAFQGIPGSFSSSAVRIFCGDEAELVGTSRFRDIFEAVVCGTVDCGVVPVENAIAGSVHEVYDLLAEFDVGVVAEAYCKVSLSLLVPSSVSGSFELSIGRLTQVLSHPKALEQCSHFFQRHPHLTQVVHSDTAGAAREVSRLNSENSAALASDEAGKLYGLRSLVSNVQNQNNNSTRFFEIRRRGVADQSNGDKASFILTLNHKPGALVSALNAFAFAGTNLTKIESRPIPGQPYHYRFFIDAKGPLETLKEAAVQCRRTANSLIELGYYAEAAAVEE